MVPFRVYDKENQQVWQIINYHPDTNGGSYLASYDGEEPGDESSNDGKMKLITVEELVKLKFVDFLEEVEAYDE